MKWFLWTALCASALPFYKLPLVNDDQVLKPSYDADGPSDCLWMKMRVTTSPLKHDLLEQLHEALGLCARSIEDLDILGVTRDGDMQVAMCPSTKDPQGRARMFSKARGRIASQSLIVPSLPQLAAPEVPLQDARTAIADKKELVVVSTSHIKETAGVIGGQSLTYLSTLTLGQYSATGAGPLSKAAVTFGLPDGTLFTISKLQILAQNSSCGRGRLERKEILSGQDDYEWVDVNPVEPGRTMVNPKWPPLSPQFRITGFNAPDSMNGTCAIQIGDLMAIKVVPDAPSRKRRA